MSECKKAAKERRSQARPNGRLEPRLPLVLRGHRGCEGGARDPRMTSEPFFRTRIAESRCAFVPTYDLP